MMMCSMFLDPLQPDLLCEEYVLVCAMFPDPLQLYLLYEEYVLVCAMFPDPLQPNLLCDGYMGGGGASCRFPRGKDSTTVCCCPIYIPHILLV